MKKILKKIIYKLFWLLKWFFITSIFSVILFRFIPVPFTPLMLIRTVEQYMDNRPIQLKKKWVSIDKIPNHMQLAVVCAEDQKFLEHWGFDVEAIEKAVENNSKSKRKKGASTISQQTAKNVFLWPSRTWFRKGLEVYFTLLIEIFWSKERIMTVYLNCIEFGDGVYGVQAASKKYFNKNSHQLTKSESALLTAVLPSPLRYRVINPGKYVKSRQSWIIRQMNQWNNVLIYP